MLSLRDSIIKPDEMVTRLKEIGQNAIAVTDHGTSLGGVSIYKLLKENDIKYIHGCEFYICDDTKIKDKDNKYYHLIVLCKNETGRLNMNRLITLSNRPENRYYKPRIDFEMLSKYGDGLIILSACLAGEISRFLFREDYERAEKTALKYKERFGEDYYLEIQSRMERSQIIVNKRIKELAAKLGIECAVTTDAHYTYKSDQKYQNKYAFNGSYKEDGETYTDCYIQSELEIRENLDYFDDDFIDRVISNTSVIADKCNVEMPLSAPIMPHIEIPPEYSSDKEWLESLCEDGFKKKLNIDVKTRTTFDPERTQPVYLCDNDGELMTDNEGNPIIKGYEPWIYTDEELNAYIDRYEYELNALDKMGFVGYILLVYSYANVAERRGIARGSGGGSLINYVTNITDIDPIEHGLYFERFIDVGALDLLESGEITAKELKIPDIDLDFSGKCCNDVMNYLYNRYGEDRVASIGKFGTNQTKGTIRDMCKVLDIDLATADSIAKSFEHYEIEDIDNMISGAIPKEHGAATAIYYVESYEELFDYVRKLNGLPKSFGLHSCGKVVATKDLDYFLPSCYDSNGIRYLQGDMHDVEDVGLVKIDVLGLRTLDEIYDTLEQSGQTKDFIDSKQNYHDPKVLDIFRKGDTAGVFQMASPGMKKTLKNMNVSGIEDISIANALYRPGAMAYIDDFCSRKQGKTTVEYLHPDLEPILKNTYGIIVFQEQLIEIGRLAGLRNPDLLRKATGKKNPALLNQVKPELEEKLKQRGWSDEQFNKLWEDMLAFARYSFNKCVSKDTKFWMGETSLTVEQLYFAANDIDYAKKMNLEDIRKRILKNGNYGTAISYYEDGYLRANTITNIQQAGVKDLIHIKTKSGKYITCTGNHKIPTRRGIKEAKDIVAASIICIGDEVCVADSEFKFEEVVFKYSCFPVMTYDVTMADPAHNFMANNGILVCNSHSSAYGIIAYDTAKLKAYYPAEFYAGLCNSYIDKSSFVKDNAAEITEDMERHNIPIQKFDYKQDHRKCLAVDGKVRFGIPLIKDCNISLGENLYEISKQGYKTFYEIIDALIESGANSRQINILIKLDFFTDFGNANELLHMVEAYDFLKYGEAKKITRIKAAESGLESLIAKYSTNKNKDGSESKSYTIIDIQGLLSAVENDIRQKQYPDVPFREKIKSQKEVLGFINLTTNKDEDRRKLIILDVFPLKSRGRDDIWAYRIKAKSVGSGLVSSLTVREYIYSETPVMPMDIIFANGISKNAKGYWYLDEYRKIE